MVRQIHADYVHAGVGAITANTFRTQRRALAAVGLAERAAELTGVAVRLARMASRAPGLSAGQPDTDLPCLVLGSAPPLEDCYRPDRVPEATVLEREHREHACNLDEAGVDAVLVETMNTRREAVVATRAVVARALPALTSFVCWNGARLLSGEPLADAAAAARDAGASALLVNCLPASNVGACLEVLAEAGLPFGAYANLGSPEEGAAFTRSDDCSPEVFAAHALGWLRAGAHILGGCCGTTPEHLRAVRRGLGHASR